MFGQFIGRAALASLLLIVPAIAQSTTSPTRSSSQQSSPAPSSSANPPSVTVFSTTSSSLSTSVSGTGSRAVVFSTYVADIINVTSTITPTPSPTSSTAASASASASATPAPIALDTKVDPAFGVLGALLILTGIPTAFLGHKNRWTSFFLIGYYTLSIVCLALILRFGVLNAVNPPSATIRGMFVLSCTVAGVVGGGLSIFFWKATKYFIGAWGGLAFGFWIQCFHNGGLIHPVAYRWIMFIGCSVVGFVACTIPQIHYHVLLLSTAIAGASSIMLGVDCYTTAGLKEFYVWNLGFKALFPKFTENGIQFPVSQTMQVELGLIGAIAVMGAAVQFRILGVLQRKLEEIKLEQRRRDALDEAKDAERFLKVDEEKQAWERQHPSLGKHARVNSDFSSMALMKDADIPGTPDTESATAFGRPRHPSGLSDFMLTPTDDDMRPRSQTFSALPALDLGTDVERDMPQAYITEQPKKANLTQTELEDLRRKEELLAEIEGIRSSIDKLKAETPSGSESRSRHASLTSRRTLSYDFNTAVLPEAAHARPLHSQDPRIRTSSLGASSTLSPAIGIGRPSSAPLQDEAWENYVRERKLLQPPSGVTPPIPTTDMSGRTPSPRIAMSPAVQAALAQRARRESVLDMEGVHGGSSVISPVPRSYQAAKRSSSYIPPNILPPSRSPVPVGQHSPSSPSPRTVTYEELTQRHREKMRELQGPLTSQEKERMEVETARARWERSRQVEKQDVERRLAERAQHVASRVSPVDDRERRPSRHSRSFSADKLAAAGGSGTHNKRASLMKVEDWQRYQTQADEAAPRRSGGPSPVPFPNDRRNSRRMSNLPSPRDPPT